MEFTQAITTCLKKYVEFEGRAGRSEFWWFVLFSFLVQFVLSFFGDWVGRLANLALLLPSLAVGARRLHDIGKSGWFQLLWFVPVIGWIVLIYWAVQPSGPANTYGAGPGAPLAIEEKPPGAV